MSRSMCCRFAVDSTLGKTAIHAMFDLSGFQQLSESRWSRQFPDRDGKARYVVAYFYGTAAPGQVENIVFNLVPTIGGHSIEEHRTGAIEAAFICQLMQVIQEQSGDGLMKQHSLIGACGAENESSERFFKPHGRLMSTGGRALEQFDLCQGFRTVLADGIAIVMEGDDV